jgi:diguanylate cyclase (GGDEF)-like protein
MSYRWRLLLYLGMLLVLLVGMMTLSFRAARDVIDLSAQERLNYAALRKHESLQAEREELRHYTEHMAADARLQQHVDTGGEPGAANGDIEAYYESRFQSMAVDCHLLVSAAGAPLLGMGCPGLADQIRKRQPVARDEFFYFMSSRGVMVAALRPLLSESPNGAVVAVARVMDEQWLNRHERRSADYLLFFERDGRILWSSNPEFHDASIDTLARSVRKQDKLFRMHEVALDAADSAAPRLWVAVSQDRLMEMLSGYQRWLYVFTTLGAAAILLVGWLMLRNFQRPFRQLMRTTDEMMRGELPVMSRTHSRTEMDLLVNRFADMLDALRRERSELRRAHQKLQETAITDSLTELYNRRYLLEVSTSLFAQAERDGRYLMAILMDLDWFKDINDRHGHLGGDAVLVHFSRLLRHNSRASDQLFRVGGEEFMILAVTDDPGESVTLADKLRILVQASPARYQEVEIPISVSAGISCCCGDSRGASLSQLMRMADKALYEAKASGRNRVVLHSSCHSATASVRGDRPAALIEGRFPPLA